jgi:hypothetical protein
MEPPGALSTPPNIGNGEALELQGFVASPVDTRGGSYSETFRKINKTDKRHVPIVVARAQLGALL